MKKSVRFFVATDKPKEETKIYKFKPFHKIRDGEKKIVYRDAKDIYQLVKDVNDCVSIRSKEGTNYVDRFLDIIPFDLKNSDYIPDEDLKKIEGFLLDLHSLRKKEVFQKLCDLIRRLEYNYSTRKFLDIFFIMNNKNNTLLENLKIILMRKEFEQWHPCGCYEDLKEQINRIMILFNHPRYKIIFDVYVSALSSQPPIMILPNSSASSNLEIKKDIIGILESMPEQKLNSIDFEEFAKIDEEEGNVIELDRDKALSNFYSNHEFGDWFLTELSQRVAKKPEKYFPNINNELDKLEQQKFGFADIKHQFESKIKNTFEKDKAVNSVVKELEAEFQKGNFNINEGQIKYEIGQILNGIENFNNPLNISVAKAKSTLEGKLFVCINEKKLDKKNEGKLDCFGINEMKNFRLLDNTPENFSKLTEYKGVVDIKQFHTVSGQLDLVDLP